MNDVQLLELVAETDLYGPDSPLPGSAWTRAVAFREIERRIGMDARDTTHESRRIEGAATEPTVPGAPRRRWSGALVAAVAFVVVLGIVGAVLAAVNLGGGEDVAGNTADEAFGIDSALMTANAYAAAERSWDVQAALALLTPQLREGLGAEVERRLTLLPAAGWTRTEGECTATGDASAVVVECVASYVSALDSAIGAPGFETTVTMNVTPDGIAQVFENPTDARVTPETVLGPFRQWLRDAHPEDADHVGRFLEWSSVEAAEASAAIVLTYADEYASYLDANGCSYDQPCNP